VVINKVAVILLLFMSTHVIAEQVVIRNVHV